MFKRHLEPYLKKAAEHFPVVSLTGPRQSGKSTLVKEAFPHHAYASLEDPDLRREAMESPKSFLTRWQEPLIIDEAQYAPELFSQIQIMADENKQPGKFILTGSQNFMLLSRVTQSLAGRAAILHLLPLSLSEIQGWPPADLEKTAHGASIPPEPASPLWQVLFTGFYPRIHDQKIPPRDWLASYERSYLERDVRQVTNVGDLNDYERFLRLCAGRSGQLATLSSLASDTSVSHPTAKRWLSILSAGFIASLLPPYFRNFNKRITKTPKLYFNDTGLLCYLLGIRSPEELAQHPLRGAIFETYVYGELAKACLNRGEAPSLFFWRGANGREVDFLVQAGPRPLALEAKSGERAADDAADGIMAWNKTAGKEAGESLIITGGSQRTRLRGVEVLPWWAV